MKRKILRAGCSQHLIRYLVIVICVTLLLPGNALVFAQAQQQPDSDEAVKIPTDQLDALVAPIALYPDPLLSQTLVASTYPLEIVQLQQWLVKQKGLKDEALVDAVSKEPWDPSIQAMAALPDVVKRLADDIQWTTDLGNAFLAQQSDVMDAVQRMRAKARETGALKSNEQMRVETEVVESKSVIVIQQAQPEVVYVPSYNPTVVYGAAVYPYPPIYYPPIYTGGIIAASAITFGVGIAMGAAFRGGWGWGCGWGRGDVNINRNNNFNRTANINNASGNRAGNTAARNTGNKWQHNPQHRGGAPYSNRATANKFGGTARGDSLANRQAGARQQVGRQGGNLSSANPGGVGDRGGVSNRASAGMGDRGGVSNRAGTGAGDRSVGSANRSAGSGNLGGGGDRVGNRSVPSSSGAGSRGGFGGGSGGYNGASTRASSSRGAYSMGGSRGGFGGGGRGGGGRRR